MKAFTPQVTRSLSSSNQYDTIELMNIAVSSWQPYLSCSLYRRIRTDGLFSMPTATSMHGISVVRQCALLFHGSPGSQLVLQCCLRTGMCQTVSNACQRSWSFLLCVYSVEHQFLVTSINCYSVHSLLSLTKMHDLLHSTQRPSGLIQTWTKAA